MRTDARREKDRATGAGEQRRQRKMKEDREHGEIQTENLTRSTRSCSEPREWPRDTRLLRRNSNVHSAMCNGTLKDSMGLLRLLFFLLGIVLTSVNGQNAESRGVNSIRSTQDETNLLHDATLRDGINRRVNWDSPPEGERALDKDRRTELSSRDTETTEPEVTLRGDGNKNVPFLPSIDSIETLRSLNDTGNPDVTGDRCDDGKRCNEGSKASSAENSREPERRGKKGQMSTRRSSSPSRNAVIRMRAKRRRGRKNRERKRGRKRQREYAEKKETRGSKYKSFLHSRNNSSDNLREFAASLRKANPRDRLNLDSNFVSDTTSRSDIRDQSTPPAVTSRRPTFRRENEVENVERELSKQLEREITRSGLDDTFNLDDRIMGPSYRNPTRPDIRKSIEETKPKIQEKKKEQPNQMRFGNSRYDAEKMLGYSKIEKDLPILDLKDEGLLARTIKDYNSYVANSLKFSLFQHFGNFSTRVHEQPAVVDAMELERFRQSTESTSTTTSKNFDDEGNARGDLSCINGTFVPAPLARHALIKYVKSSIPGHEYLEADYECAPGFLMVSSSTRLLCQNRQWIGQVPKCKMKKINNDVCSEATCEHVCKELDGKPVCSCYKGFRLSGSKCIDINECTENNGGCEYKCSNTPGSYRCECPKGMKQGEDKFTCTDVNECLLNNGHGPCQDTCRNLLGGYECSCEGLRDTILSPDNHTCQDAGPCALDNAGCSHTCLSTMGRVFCLCPDGFMLKDDWKTCQDIDECAVPDLQTEACRYGCINTPGSYRCAEPQEPKDQPLSDNLSITCLPGYEAAADGTCVDTNECTNNNAGCSEVCENTDGSFFCACDGDEKALSADGKSCVDINNVACPPLNPAGRGYLMCTRSATPKPWRGRRRAVNRPGTKCFLKCPHGYQLHGEYELSCRSDGTWDGPKHGECVRYRKPRLECPKDVIAELPPGQDEAFVTFDQPATDLDWFRYVRSKPSWGTRLEANLKSGVHEITFFARHPVSKKQASCVLRIIVKGGEAPKVKDCPKDIEVTGKNGTTITWVEPIFTDNVKVTRINSNESPGHPFDIGGHKIEYEATDEAGWSSKCVFTVVLRQE